MKMLKNKLKIILVIVITAILFGGLGVYATYNYLASDVSYTRDGTTMSVEDALNDLYKTKTKITKLNVTGSGIEYSNYYYFYITDYENYNNLTIDNLSIQFNTTPFRATQQSDACGRLDYTYEYNASNGCITVTLDGTMYHQSWSYPAPNATVTIIE